MIIYFANKNDKLKIAWAIDLFLENFRESEHTGIEKVPEERFVFAF